MATKCDLTTRSRRTCYWWYTATLLFVLPTPPIAVHLGKILAVLLLLAVNSRWAERRAWYAFVLFLVVLMADLFPVTHRRAFSTATSV